jgi:hypothetical protein
MAVKAVAGLPNLGKLQTSEAATLEATTPVAPPASASLIESPFQIDEEAEALKAEGRKQLIDQLFVDAKREDEIAAVAQIRQSLANADRATDKARCLRVAAEHLCSLTF